jgi:hypothetical protein
MAVERGINAEQLREQNITAIDHLLKIALQADVLCRLLLQ